MQSGVDLETIISLEASAIKFGEGATAELGYEVKRRGCRNVVLITDKRIAKLLPVEQSIESLTRESIKVTLYNNAEVEPTDKSFMAAAEFARSGSFDGFVAVGGGSVIDTAKAANLYSTYPAEFLTYVNKPVGKGAPVPGMCKPLFAIPTTAGTGSETTGVAIFDFLEMSTKTGISSRELRPVLGIVDPNHTKTLPPMVAAASGFDVLSHALESYTALPFDKRVSPSSPVERPSYQGSNPVSDVWALKAIEMVAKNMYTAVTNPQNDFARSQMMLAATIAGIGFGNAGCHLPHGMSYTVSGMVRNYSPKGYENNAIVPHGMAVILNAPAVFRFTADSNLDRHERAAKIMGEVVKNKEDAGEALATAIIKLMKQLDMPNGLSAVGYSEKDVPLFVKNTLPQQRVLGLSPKPVGEKELELLFSESLRLW